MPVNRSDLIAAIAERTDLTRTQAESALVALQDVLVATVSAGDAVRIPGLMTVERTERAARVGRNPRTGEPLEIKAGFGVKLTAGSALKAAVRGEAVVA